MRAFSFYTAKGEPRIGLEIDGVDYNFTYIWQIFKELKNSPQTPDLFFLQIMIEMENFSDHVFNEVIGTVREYRPLNDLILKEKFSYGVPISRPEKILCIGRNYAKHADEMKSNLPESPLFFSKLPSSLLSHEKTIALPTQVGRIDHEVELAAVIGKTASNVGLGKALEYVAGYTIANDITARELQSKAKESGQPWTLSKGMDCFCPMGPFLVSADAIENPHDLQMELSVNGEIKQKANTGEMIFKIPELIVHISKHITLQPGDIILTGTPHGVSEIRPGDVIEAKIEGIGVLRNRVAT
jgi:2-keto-4-pentenoate hydratase/2-oxohepta-3-ene-1,7-dioic acid hydratase in catechol pathway